MLGYCFENSARVSMWRLIGMSDRRVHTIPGRAREWQVGGWQTDILSYLEALLQGHDKLSLYPSEIYIILTSKGVIKKLKLFIFSEADDQVFWFIFLLLHVPKSPI